MLQKTYHFGCDISLSHYHEIQGWALLIKGDMPIYLPYFDAV